MLRPLRLAPACLLALFILLLPPLYTGVHSQVGRGEPAYAVPAALANLPPMVYQPPLDARSLEEFISPGAVVIPVAVNLPGGPITSTPPLPLPTLEPPISLTLTAPLPTLSAIPITRPLHTEGSLSLPISPTLTAPLPAPPTLPPVPTIEPTVTPPISTPLEIPIRGTFTNVVRFDQGQLAVVIEADTVVADSQLLFTALPVPYYPLTATNSISDPVGTVKLMHFQLEMLQDGVAVDSFAKPVRIVVDMRSLAENLNPVYAGNFFLAYEDENEPGLWHDVPITIHQEGGLISAEVTHFSTWTGGSRPERWNPSLVQPTVSEFSGAATYNYPLDVPPGRNGLQPALSLSYNSRALDGAIQDLEAGDIANGWSLAQIAIMRQGVKVKKYGGPLYIYHPDNFSLVLNGVSHQLKPAGNSITNGTVRFYAKDAPGLRVWRYYDDSLPTDGLYWVVTTADGVQYRLGYTADSEEYQQGTLWYADPLTHWGKANNRSAIAWNVDTVTDAYGNQMQYDYFTDTQSETVSGGGYSLNLTTRTSRLQQIAYNYPNRITNLPATNLVNRLTSTPATTIRFRATTDTNPTFSDPISHVLVFHNGSTYPIKEYRITSDTQSVDSSGCERLGNPRDTETDVVTAIQLYTNTDGQVSTDDLAYAFALPPVTFEYTSKVHFTDAGQNCFYFRYLYKAHTGYGGTTTFTYTSDNRDVGDYEYTEGLDQTQWPEIGHNYYVTQVKVDDGRNAPVKTTYSYSTPCYDQKATGVTRCDTSISPEYGNIVGFASTTQSRYDYNGSTILNKQTTSFSQSQYTTIGRPTQVDVLTNGNVLLSSTAYSYNTQGIGGIANMFSFTSQVVSTQYHNGSGSASLSSKVAYAYDTSFQGGSQYGNLTHIYEYDDANAGTPYRTTHRYYYPRNDTNSNGTGYWLVNRVGLEALYQGSSLTQLEGTWIYYDGSTSPDTPPTKGATTRIRRFLMNNDDCNQIAPATPPPGCAHLYLTAESSFAYDSYGNQTYQYGSNEYGYQAFNSNWGLLAGAAPATETTTQITYETGYHLYPIQMTLSGSGLTTQTTTFQIYGFNGVGLTGFQEQRGLLKQVTEANGITTKYEYDPFGRLYAVYDGYDNFAGFGDSITDNGDPVSRYLYWDNNWNNSVTYLDPAGGKPFVSVVVSRPSSYPAPANSSSTAVSFNEQTFYDGFGRPIQNRSIWNRISGQSNSREIYSSTAYHANGQVSCQTVPYDLAFYSDSPRNLVWPASAFDTAACTSKPRTTTTYDALGRPDIITAPDGSTTNRDYKIISTVTVNGFSKLAQTVLVDANQRVTAQFTNARGQLSLVREYTNFYPNQSGSADTRYHYDEVGNLEFVGQSSWSNSQPGSWLATTSMEYDAFGRKLSMDDPDMGDWTYSYDAAGNLTEQIDANQQKLCFEYDNLNRISVKRFAASASSACPTSGNRLASYSYYNSGTGKIGQLSGIHWAIWTSPDTQNHETFDYDSLGRLTSHTRIIDDRSYTMSYGGFDAFHRPTTITYPDNEVVTIGYDHEGENSLSTSYNSGTALVDNLTYNARGQMVWLDRNGVSDTTYSYFGQNDAAGGGTGDSNYRLQAIEHGSTTDGKPDFNYTYDLIGNILSLDTTYTQSSTSYNDAQDFGYDHLHRLTSASATGNVANYSHSYSYNTLGNITSFAGTSYGYGDAAHKHAVTSRMAGVYTVGTYSYDANGNMTSRTENGTTYMQNFNVENELSSVTANGQTTSFTYDAAGIRVKTVKPDGTVIDTPFPGYEVENPTGTAITRRTYSLAGQMIATRVSGDPVSGNNGLFFYLSDHLGSMSILLDSSNNGVRNNSRTYYYPFGGYRGTAPSQGITDRDFTGQRENMELGLLYYQARYYLPGVGRFLSADTVVPDPANPQAFNRYSYVNNRPIVWNDPTGHSYAEGYGGSGQVACETSTGGANCIKTTFDEETAAKIANTVNEVVATTASTLYEPADWAIALADGFQWHDSLGMLPLIPSAFGDEIGGFVAHHWDEFAAAIGRRYGDNADEALDAARHAFGMCSFSADTLVLTEAGMEPISEVANEELVWAFNEKTGEMGWYPVVAVWAHEDPITVYLTIEGEVIETTPEHPFFTVEGEWLPAATLQVGDEIRNADWATGTVEVIEFVAESQTMYNFTVATAHTYFIGEGQWLVHNDCQLPNGVRDFLVDRFSRHELEDLIFDMGLDPGKIIPDNATLDRAVDALVTHVEKNNIPDVLYRNVIEHRPNLRETFVDVFFGLTN
ncbi:MAG: hypothetical protein H6658_10760 [Ardenticatenaceae bacterium]|nr:hypothetical protein [Ardenticatenaceae bacterium]